MEKNQKVRWLTYDFNVYPPKTKWNEVGGIYIFCGFNKNNEWVAIYIGETGEGPTGNFRSRMSGHEKCEKAKSLGATHIHALMEEDKDLRKAMEEQLIAYYEPPLNKEHRNG